MKERLLENLVCPLSQSALRIEEGRSDGDEIVTGKLVSVDDDKLTYPIVDGVPYLLTETQGQDVEQTLDVFGGEWQTFADWGWIDDPGSDPDVLLQYDSGLSSDSAHDFLLKTGHIASGVTEPELGAVVLDGGCGNGRFSREAAKYAQRVIAVDASDAVHAAYTNMKKHGIDNVDVIRGSTLNLPLRGASLDYAFSIGVLQHTGDAPKMVSELTRVVKSKHRISINCYGTGNWLYEWLDAFTRRRTTKMSDRKKIEFAQRWAARSRRLALGGPIARSLNRKWRRRMVVRTTDIQMYDWYAPEIAEHYSADDVRGFLAANQLKVVAANYPIHEAGYDDGARRRVAGAFCLLLEKS